MTSFSCPPAFIPWAVLGSFGTGLSAAYCFIHPNEKPFTRIFIHEDWDFGDGSSFPILLIPSSIHGKGVSPHLEFRQGDLVFPYRIRENGDILITRDNHSFGRFKDTELIIRKNRI